MITYHLTLILYYGHNYGMIKPMIRTTVVFTPKTARMLERLSKLWSASKSETLRRIIEERALEEERMADAKQSPAEIIDLVKSGGIELLPLETAQDFVREIKEERLANK